MFGAMAGPFDEVGKSSFGKAGAEVFGKLVRDLLVASTAGNPLALRELPASLTDDQLAGRAALPDRLPVGASVERVFLEQVRRQPPGTQTLLLLAAAERDGDIEAVTEKVELALFLDARLLPVITASLPAPGINAERATKLLAAVSASA